MSDFEQEIKEEREKKETEAKKNLEAQIRLIEGINIDKTNEAYILYITALKNLNKETDEQYKKDYFGLEKELTFERLNHFKVLYENCGKYGEAFLNELKDRKDSPEYKLIENVQNMLSGDMEVINGVDESTLKNGNVSLQRLVEEARIKTVDISGKDLGTVGANMSSRIPFNYVAPDGKEMPGVFTPKSIFDISAGYDKFVDELKDAPHFIPMLKGFKTAYINYYNSVLTGKGTDPNSLTEGEKIYHGFRELYGADTHNGRTRIRGVFKKLGIAGADEFSNFTKTADGRKEFDRFAEQFAKYTNSVRVNYAGARIADKSRIDSRNSAMSTVAALLGVPNLICRAFPLKVVKDGVVTEGTFMGLATGVDINSPDRINGSIAYDVNGPVFEKTNGLKDIADLQVLDFICGNTDRHAGNMLYQFDDSFVDANKHKFTGLQGIDNDASFGSYVPRSNDENSGTRLMSLNNLRVMSKSMAMRIMSLDPEMLRFSLRGHDLSEAQLKAACERLKMLRSYVKNSIGEYKKLSDDRRRFINADLNRVLPNTVRIIEDEDFSKLQLSRLGSVAKKEYNSFDMVGAFRDLCADTMRSGKMAKPLVPETVEDKKVYVLDEDEYNWAADIVKKLNDATSASRTSDNYIAVQTAAKQYKEFCESNKGAVLSEDLYNVRNSYLRKISEAADIYCSGKKSVKRPSRYTQRRIDTVSEILNESGAKAKEDFYGDMKKGMNEDENKRYADGLRKYADKSLDDFNAKMRKMAQEIAKKNGITVPEENRGKRIEREIKL